MLKNMQPILKKQNKKKGNKRLLDSISKNDLKEQYLSKRKSKTKQNDIRKKGHILTNIVAAEDIKRSDTIIRYSTTTNKITKDLQEAEGNTDSQTKHKRRNRRRKRNGNSDQTSNNVVKSRISAVKDVEKLQKLVRRKINSKQNKTKAQDIKLINEKKMKRTSDKRETRLIKSEKMIKLNNRKVKIRRLEEMLASKAQTKHVTQKIEKEQVLTLRDRMMALLKPSRFRFINETLYNNDSSQSKQYFKEDPDAFKAYHDGYKHQLEQWPVNPLDVIISSIIKMPMDNLIADFGCGEAKLATSVPHKVYSFDFIAVNDRVEACDMAHTPLLMNSVHVVVFCLSLMGTNLKDYIMEANRVLKNDGILKIAEVESRFENIEDFIRLLGCYGFRSTWKDLSHNLFYFMDFKKVEDIMFTRRQNLPPITLKSCLYKKR